MYKTKNHTRRAFKPTANYLFKQRYGKYFAIAVAFSFFLHIVLIIAMPSYSAELTIHDEIAMEALELPPEVVIPPPPKPLAKPSIPMEAEQEIDEDITIDETVPPPPDLLAGMSQMKDIVEEEFLMVAEVMPKWKYRPPHPEIPRYIARARVKVITKIVFFVTKTGTVDQQRTTVATSSGYPELDELAIEWAKKGKFHPALQRGEPVAVRVGFVFDWNSS